ncbi:MAG: WD40 repeat domain-containing protein [Planctomycetota bacterium]|jgi:WD40 repeat protein
MKMQRLLVGAAVGCLGFLLLANARSAAPGPEAQPKKQSLTIPITLASSRSLECVAPFGPPVSLSALAFSPNGNTLAAAGYREVVLWDLPSAKLLKRIGTGELGTSIGDLAFLDDSLLAVGEGTPHASGSVRIINVETGKQTHAFEEPGEVVYSLAVSPDGKYLAAAGAETKVHVWDLNAKKLAGTIEEHSDWVLGVAFSLDGKVLATASADYSLKLWEVGTWQSVARLVDDDAVRAAAFAADGNTITVAVGGPGARGLRMRQKNNVRYKRVISTGAGMPLDVVFARKTNRLYAPCNDNTVKVFDTNARLLATLSGHEDWVYCVAVTPDGAKVASGSADGTIKLWNGSDNRLLATLAQLAPRSDEWLILTAEGYLAASSPEGLAWNTTNVSTPKNELLGLLENQESVGKAIAGEKVTPPAIK